MLQSNYNIITLLNLSNANIQLPDLVRITKECASLNRLDHFSLGGNKITRNCLVPTRPKYKTSRKQQPEEVFDELLEELTSNLCDIILNPQSSLSYLDISDLGFSQKHLLKICKTIQRNHLLQSVNFGSLMEVRELKRVVLETLQVVEDDIMTVQGDDLEIQN